MEPVDDLHQVDLNLLVALDVLLQERSVTRAARRAGVTQSAMSHTLRRLRDLLGDPLLVRGAGGMVPTPRAESLGVPLRSALVTLGRALAEPAGFDPHTARRCFRLASPDLFDVLVLPDLLAEIRAEAPGVDVAVVPPWVQLPRRLETGDADVAVVAVMEGQRAEIGDGALTRRTLFRDTFSCYVRAGHPALADGALSLEAFVALSHVLVSPGGEGPGLVDHALAELDLTRRVALRVPQFHTAPPVVAASDLVLTAPSALADTLDASAVVAVAPPLPLPGHAIAMMWHPRFHDDPGHRWFRDLLTRITQHRGVDPGTRARRHTRP